MQQSCMYGSVRGASGNWRPYRDKRLLHQRKTGEDAQCHLVFRKGGFCINCGADPLVRAGPPGPALRLKNPSLPDCKGRPGGRPRTRGSAPQLMQVSDHGKTKWHWADSLPQPDYRIRK